MNYLSVENLTKSYGEKLLFEDISFGIDAGQKVALIARNGSGKTTLLNIIAGRDIADSGKVVLRKDIRMAYLPQQPVFDPSLSVLDAILSSETRYVRAVRKYQNALSASQQDGSQDLLQEALQEMDAAQAWDFEYKVKEVLGKLKIDDIEALVETLSGGQKRKVALAKVLLDDVDLLIMDEPTNHLDIEMIEWMESFLAKQKLAILTVTHDRYFLDNLCDEILELDKQKIYRYKGKYEYFLEKKAERENAERKEVLRAKNLYRKELEWMRRMPKARTHKSKSRIEAFDGISQTASRRLDEERPEIKVKSSRLGKKILEINNLHMSFGDKLLIHDFSHTFKRGERIGIVGPNGSGKSTFFKLILGQLKPTAGRIVAGQSVVFGYFSQNIISPKEDKKVIEMVKDVAEEIPVGESSTLSASAFLTYFGFDRNTQYNYYANLSGGEKRRLQLLLSLVNNPNFLIFDEPTNDLDINTLNVLEDFLQNYDGCLLIATHDRAFIDKIVDHIFVFEGDGRIKDYHASYTEYRALKARREREAANRDKKKEANKRKSPAGTKKKPTYKQLRRLEELEKEIEALEKEKISLTEVLENATASLEEITACSEKYSETEAKLEYLTNEWLELEDEIESLKSSD